MAKPTLMICEKCKKNEATVFLTHIVGGKMQKVDLCPKCAESMGVTQTSGFTLADILLRLDEENSRPRLQKLETNCPNCGYTEAELRRTGRLGCGLCYQTFQEIIVETIKETQKKPQHCGKMPTRFISDRETRDKLAALEKNLSEAVQQEDYEVAASLRDQIRLLRNYLS